VAVSAGDLHAGDDDEFIVSYFFGVLMPGDAVMVGYRYSVQPLGSGDFDGSLDGTTAIVGVIGVHVEVKPQQLSHL
jgi:hypothetical protein